MDVKNPDVMRCLRDRYNNIENKTTPSSTASYNIDGCLGMLSTVGNIIPQEVLVGVPYNSALIKFPNLPKNNPMGTYKTMRSDSCK